MSSVVDVPSSVRELVAITLKRTMVHIQLGGYFWFAIARLGW